MSESKNMATPHLIVRKDHPFRREFPLICFPHGPLPSMIERSNKYTARLGAVHLLDRTI